MPDFWRVQCCTLLQVPYSRGIEVEEEEEKEQEEEVEMEEETSLGRDAWNTAEKSFLDGCKEGGKCIAVVDAADRHGTSLYVSAEFDSRLSGRSSFCNGNRKCSSVLIFTGEKKEEKRDHAIRIYD
ncbi:hypothetical protein HZH66_000870 [Vespula vulgaris]|uniref:Uncharacterized protein n=2 Tax=Vespula TaxID=7451 RepID=A0A834KVD5_VESVU|nr:hypothetical protein HZH66_000870 [Vespula vulgaris]